MFGKRRRLMTGVLCAALVLSFSQSADVSDIIIGRNVKQTVQEDKSTVRSTDQSAESTTTAVVSKSKVKATTAVKKQSEEYDWLDVNGELKNTVIVDKEKGYYENNNRIIIEYRNGAKEPSELSKYAKKEKDVDSLIKVYKIKSEDDTKKVIDIAKKYSSDIQIAQPDYTFSITSENSDSEDFYKSGKQWALENDGTFENPETDIEDSDVKAVEDIDLNAEGAWKQIEEADDESVRTKQVVVAVVDTGIDYSNDELKDVIWQNEDEISNGKDSDSNGYKDDIRGWNFTSFFGSGNNNVNDDNGHGTAVAGVIAAANDNKGIVGIASDINIKIMPVKSVDSKGSATMSNLISGLKYADENGASICNCSWGGESDESEIFENMLMKQIIVKSNMLFVVASGNEYVNIDRTQYIPASFTADNLITVGSIEWDGSFSWFSNYGVSSMEICAPGAGIYTVNAGGGYICEWGTSFSAPYVAGVAALAQAASGSSDGTVLKSFICNSDNIKKISGLANYCQYGGIPDAEKVVKAALNYRNSNKTTVTPQPSPSASAVPTSLPTVTPQATQTPDASQTSEPDNTGDVSATETPDVTETKNPQETDTEDNSDDDLYAEPSTTPSVTESPVSESSPSPDAISKEKSSGIKINISNSLYNGYARKINVNVTGDVSQIKYSNGKKSVSYFAKFGNEFENVNSSKFTIKAYSAGWYSVYVKAADGSETVKNVFANVKVVKVSKSKLSLKKGATYKLTASIKGQDKYPQKLTGQIYFKTSNDKIVTVNSATGKIKAKSKGKAVVTAYTKNGKSAKCIVACK